MNLSDHNMGFGGKFGVQSDRVDKSALGWDHKENVDKHESQKGQRLKRLLASLKRKKRCSLRSCHVKQLRR